MLIAISHNSKNVNKWEAIFLIESLSGLHETVNYKKNMQLQLYNNDEYENYPPHWHTPFELIMPTESTYRAVCGDKEFNLREGDILIVCPGIVHELFAPPKGVRIIFQPGLTLVNSKEANMIISMISPAILITPEEYPQIHARVRQLMLDIRDEYFSQPLYAESCIASKFIEILVLVGRCQAEITQQHFEAKNDKQKEYMDKFLFICDYINDHFAEQLTLEEVAALAGFSKYHFTRLFKQYADTSFYKYLNQKRIAHAKNLLVNKDYSVLEVALQCGFSNLSSFLRMFKQLTGCTPTELRRMYDGNFDYV